MVEVTYIESNDNEEVVLKHVAIRERFSQDFHVDTYDLSKNDQSWLLKAKMLAKNAFLPEGFPHSVSEDYIQYQLWDTVQAFASSISGSLATQAVLQGVGVGDEEATPLAATITWLLRHGSGMVSSIAFTWLQGSDLDHNCKKWRLFADIANDAAMCLELTGPFWPQEWLHYVLCSASVSRALVGVAGGATRTAITQHQARKDNISDVAAKDGSQETLVNLAALIVNLTILPLLAGDQTCIWLVFFVMTVLHIFANYMAVKSLIFETLNRDRLLMVLDYYCKSQKVPKPQVVNFRESPFFGLEEKNFCGKKITLGASCQLHLNQLLKAKPLGSLKQALNEDKFLLVSNDSEVSVILSKECQPSDLLKAFCTAYFFAQNPNQELEFEDLEEALKRAGWKTSHLQIATLNWRGDFS